jgi:hypothetical protein
LRLVQERDDRLHILAAKTSARIEERRASSQQ